MGHDTWTASPALSAGGAPAENSPQPLVLPGPASQEFSFAGSQRMREPFIIGVAGGSASGKTSVCQAIITNLRESSGVPVICLDWFYKSLTQEERKNVANFNFDHPNAFDIPLMLEHIEKFKRAPVGGTVEVPIYDYVNHCRSKETKTVRSGDVIIVEGILVFNFKELLDLMHIKIFVDTDDDVRLCRRMKRDIAERGRDVVSVIKQYETFVKPAFDEFIYPSKKWADVIIPRGIDNLPAINLITQHIQAQLEVGDIRKIFPKVKMMPSTFQIRSLHTIIRDAKCSRTDFVFYCDRLIRLLIEFGLGFLPFFEKNITTPTGAPYEGVGFIKDLCGVSIIRAGESMESGLRAVCKNIRIGKMLIQRDTKGERKLVYGKVPPDVSSRHILVLDPILASGKTLACAIEFMKSKGAAEEKILCFSLIASPQGIAHVCKMYPKVNIITSEIDYSLDERGMVLPGIGVFGDRYFGTEDESPEEN